MSDPCGQEKNISEIWLTVDALKDATARMETSVSRMVDEFTSLSKDLRDNMLDNRELKTRIDQNTRALDTLFAYLREEQSARAIADKEIKATIDSCKKEDIDPIWTWKDQMDGRIDALKYIPIACACISALAALVTILK